jgi:hypothetical protein
LGDHNFPANATQIVLNTIRQFMVVVLKDSHPTDVWGVGLSQDHEQPVLDVHYLPWASECLWVELADPAVAREVYDNLTGLGFDELIEPAAGGTAVFMMKRAD